MLRSGRNIYEDMKFQFHEDAKPAINIATEQNKCKHSTQVKQSHATAKHDKANTVKAKQQKASTHKAKTKHVKIKHAQTNTVNPNTC